LWTTGSRPDALPQKKLLAHARGFFAVYGFSVFTRLAAAVNAGELMLDGLGWGIWPSAWR